MAWNEELKAKVVKAYKDANPTPETSVEIIKEIADANEQSPNGVRMVLIQAGVYVKKDTATAPKTGDSPAKEGGKRVSKESSLGALKDAIRAAGKDVDDEIIDKLTGKAAIYFTSLLK